MRRAVSAAAALLALVACVGTTGSDLVTFAAYAGGPEGATGAPLVFTNGRAYTVTLTRAVVHVGAVYLNRSVPISGGQELSCIQPGIYVAEVRRGLDVNALSAELVPFPEAGSGTADRAVSGEVWLTGGDVNAVDDPTVVLDAAGVAERDGARYPFEAKLTIGKNRAITPADPARPGANPLCKQRIVSPIPTDLVPTSGGALVLRVDPRGMFANVDFAALAPGDGGIYRFADVSEGQPNVNVYRGLRTAAGVYAFTWRASP